LLASVLALRALQLLVRHQRESALGFNLVLEASKEKSLVRVHGL
jgi:hypothetical protein